MATENSGPRPPAETLGPSRDWKLDPARVCLLMFVSVLRERWGWNDGSEISNERCLGKGPTKLPRKKEARHRKPMETMEN